MAEGNNLIEIAKRDLTTAELVLGTGADEIMQNMAAYHVQQAIEKVIKQLIADKRGYGNIEHDIERLIQDAKTEEISIPDWVEENSYEISKWATTIRYNSNFKTNRDSIFEYIKNTKKWIESIKR